MAYDMSLFDFVKSSPIELHHKIVGCWKVFWTQNEFLQHHLSSEIPGLDPQAANEKAISEKIRYALYELGTEQRRFYGFAQFWAVEKIGGRQLLTTVDQPFSMNRLTSGYREYRKHSVMYKYNVNERIEEEEEGNLVINGPPARAFLNHLPEACISLRHQSLAGYPLLGLASECGMESYIVLPVFQPSTASCVGVLEYSTSFSNKYDDHLLNVIKKALKGVGLSTYDVREHIPYQVMDGLQHAKDELTKALKSLRKSAIYICSQAWISYEDKNRILAARLVRWSFCNFDFSFNYEIICDMVPLKTGEGLVMKAFQTANPCYCRDVSFLTNMPPLSPITGLRASSFTICLRSCYTGSLDYVLEFLWDESHSYMIFLDSIIGILKLHLPSFKVASGEELGTELCVLRVNSSLENDLETFQICKDIQSPKKEGGVVEEQFTMNGTGVLQHTSRKAISKRKHKTTPISLSLEDITQQYGLTQEKAARNLGVSLSILKRRCEKYRIYEWPGPKMVKREESDSHGNGRHATGINTGALQDKFGNAFLTIKVEYGDDIIKFKLPSSTTTLRAVEEEIAKSFQNLGSFRLKYKDGEGELISIIHDQQLRDYIKFSSLMNRPVLRLLILPLTTQV